MDSQGKLYRYLIIALLAVNLFLGFQLAQFRSYTNQQLQNIHHAVRNVEATVSSSLGNIRYEITEANKWLVHASFSVDEQLSGNGFVALKGEWGFSEMEKDAEVYIQYRSEDEAWKRLDMQQSSGNQYMTTLQLDPAKQYEYQIVADGANIRSTSIQGIDRYQYGYQDYYLELSSGTSTGRQSDAWTVHIRVNAEPPLPWLMIESAKLMAMKGEQLLYETEFTVDEDFVRMYQAMEEEMRKEQMASEKIKTYWPVPYQAFLSLDSIGGSTEDVNVFVEVIYGDGHIQRDPVGLPWNP